MVVAGGAGDCSVTGPAEPWAKSRMNVPGRADGNWGWRCRDDMFSSTAFQWLHDLTESSQRLVGQGVPRSSGMIEAVSMNGAVIRTYYLPDHRHYEASKNRKKRKDNGNGSPRRTNHQAAGDQTPGMEGPRSSL